MHTMQPWGDSNDHGVWLFVLGGLFQHFMIVFEYLAPFPLVAIITLAVLLYSLLHSPRHSQYVPRSELTCISAAMISTGAMRHGWGMEHLGEIKIRIDYGGELHIRHSLQANRMVPWPLLRSE